MYAKQRVGDRICDMLKYHNKKSTNCTYKTFRLMKKTIFFFFLLIH